MNRDYIFQQTKKPAAKYGTRDPFELLECVNVVVNETDRYKRLKGYCFLSCRTFYVMINSFLPKEEKRIVAAHELGRIVLHKRKLQMAPMQNLELYNMTDNTEYEANLFSANLLVSDEEMEQAAQDPELNYFGICSSLYVSPWLKEYHSEIELVSCGGESGDDARICDFGWVLNTMNQCVEYDVPFHFHQTGYNFQRNGRIYHIPWKDQHTQAARAGVNYPPITSSRSSI